MNREVDKFKADLIKMTWFMRGGMTFSEIMLSSHKEREAISELIKHNMETTNKTRLPFF